MDSDVKFRKLADFGTIRKTPRRFIVVSLQEKTVKEDGEEKTDIYLSFHEFYKNDEGKLLPRRTKNTHSKYPEKIISFVLDFDPTVVGELKSVADNIDKYMKKKIQPGDKF